MRQATLLELIFSLPLLAWVVQILHILFSRQCTLEPSFPYPCSPQADPNLGSLDVGMFNVWVLS